MNDVERELEHDLALLAAAEERASAHFHVWSTAQATVVVGRAVQASDEVDEAFCARFEIPVVRRPSGGRSVLVGRGTVQYTFALPYSLAEELTSIAGAKTFCNRIVIAALERASSSHDPLEEDVSGDLQLGGRKVAGLAMRRCRRAMLLHGSVLVDADLPLIGRALRHPLREPAYRCGRSHAAFLANLGSLDEERFRAAAREMLAACERRPRDLVSP
jgi:lipoate-protein ligase A